jgi:hypothetical protein
MSYINRIGHPNFELVMHDVVEPYMMEVDEVSSNIQCMMAVSLFHLLFLCFYPCFPLDISLGIASFTTPLPIQRHQDN